MSIVRPVPELVEGVEGPHGVPLRQAQRATAVPEGVDPAEAAVAQLLAALGRGPGLDETPRRVAATFRDLLTREEVEATTFPNDPGYAELVLIRDIPFHSLCEHHLLPFRGVAHVGYMPRDRLVGISTLPRIVEYFARDLQLQERMTANIGQWLMEQLDPLGVGVIVEAEQLCMSLRGIGTATTITTTSCFLGEQSTSSAFRAQFPPTR